VSAIELLRQLQRQGISLVIEDGKLVSKAEKGKLTLDIANQIKANRDAIIALLQSTQSVRQGISLPSISASNEQAVNQLSYGQKRLWLLDRLQQGSSQYHMPMAFKVSGRLDRRLIDLALKKLICRHHVLRTCFSLVEGNPNIELRSESAFALQFHRISEEQVGEFMAAFFSQPFDLSKDYMIKACLLSCSDSEFVLLLNIHHIASDGWSMDLINEELLSFYQAEYQNTELSLAPLPVQYSDYAQWQNKLLSEPHKSKLQEYWSERLKTAPSCHSLVLGRSRPAVFSPAGGKVIQVLPAALKKKMDHYCQQYSVSHNHILKATFGLLLHRFSSASKIVIGSPVANRPLKEMASMIGFFVNTLPFMFDFELYKTPKDFIEQVKQLELLDIEHQHLPFDLMVESLSPKRDLSLSPIFQVVFAMQNYQAKSRTVADVEMTLIPQQSVQAKYDLSLYVYNQDQHFELQFEYASSLFDRETIVSMAESYLCLLTGMLEEPTQFLANIDFVSIGQKQLLNNVSKGEAVSKPYSTMVNALSLIERSCANFGNNTALSDGVNSMTYLEFMAKIATVQKQLQLVNVCAGDKVALIMPRTMDLFVINFAIMGMGAIYIPIDHDLPEHRMHYILRDSKAKLVISHRSILELGTLNNYQTIANDSLISNDSISDNLLCVNRASDAAYIIYTSGSTGNPKGTLISHQGLFALADTLVNKCYATPEVKVLQFANMCFDASVLEWLVAFSNGGCLFVLGDNDTRDPVFVQNFMAKNCINHSFLPPSYLSYLDPAALPDLTTLGTGGEKIDLPIAQKWQHGRRYYNGYGPTETTVIITLQEYNQLPKYVTIGTPTHGVNIKVVDPQNRLVPIGCPGELLIAGWGTALCYLNQPELTDEKFIKLDDGLRYYRSGDLVKQKANGELIYLGRNDRQVKIRGLRIELGEIEAKLSSLSGVKLGCVKVFEQVSGAIIAGYCEVTDNQLNNQLIRSQLKELLPDYMLPASIEILEMLPLTSNGKIDYRALQEPQFKQLNDVEPTQGETEEHLHNIWCKLLGHSAFGATESFFDVGGHSLLLTNLLNEIDKKWEINLPMQQVFQHPDIRHIAILLDTLLPQSITDIEHADVEMEGGFL
jgi:amino acid adenylation domain-containing protein